MNDSGLIAKTVIVSTLLTTLVLLGVFYIFRADVIALIAEPDGSSSEFTPEPVSREPIADAVEGVNAAVVSVVVTKDVPIYERYYETLSPWGFFGNITVPRVRESGTEEREVGGGTGFVVSSDGLIVTNHHVIADSEARYSVLLSDGTAYQVDILDSEPEIDIAILKISEPIDSLLTVAEFGDSSELRLGQTVIAIGNALAEFQNSVSVGVVSGLARNIVATDSAGMREELQAVIQTDAAINPGNSGGPLLNIDGRVVGVNVATSRGADNIGFAIPVNVVSDVVNSVITYGEIVQPYLGVRYATVTPRLVVNADLPVEYGALLIAGENDEPAVLPDSPGALAGLEEGDVIVAIGGESLEGRDLRSLLREFSVNETVAIEVVRGDDFLLLEATLGRGQ